MLREGSRNVGIVLHNPENFLIFPLLLSISFSVGDKNTQKYDHRSAAKSNIHNIYSIFSNTHAILQMVVGRDGLFPIVPKGKAKTL